ncbi:PRTRC system ParB family protein [Shewanella oncorhynchi]|uniref:PRTRC system ParB family protein n=1 Tax=Shewanella TaxID=22 RepID=UPI0021D94176|nr:MULTISPECIES: PRTRC system ParB family protein [unclassified Shewanella]MCU8056186.1 PRTRC system ParB family protein [Shewanella sp. SM35]MCU8065120.1 PRTRC system ParB family protein [Shewanella sp. SM34]
MNATIQTTATHNTMLPISRIDALPFGNSRRSRNDNKFSELKESIRIRGVIQPVLVRPADDRFELVAGEGRFIASKELGLTEIPVLVKLLSDAEALEHQIEENLNREDLNLVDECKAVQQLSAFYNGDRQAIADRLSWTMRKVNERVEILKCCEEVLDAVLDGSITVGHALLLAPFSTKLQKGTLMKIIDEKWTVTYLRERASKGQQYLNLAKFDTAACNTCPHNSAAQSGLFGLDDHKAACSNINCFKEKTAEWLEVRKAELADQYGTVLLVQQINENDRNTVDAITVGEEQFTTGCQACEKRVVLVDDRLGRALGTTYENQCIDNLCFSKCVKALTQPVVTEKEDESLVAPLENEQGDTSESVVVAQNKAKMPKEAKKDVNCVVPKKVIETNKAMLRQTSVDLLMPQECFQLAMTYAALKRLSSNYKAIHKELSNPCRFEDTFKAALRLNVCDLKAEIQNITLHLASKESDQTINMTNMMIDNITFATDAKAVAVAKWIPTKENLSEYTIGSLSALCIKAGVDKAMDSKKEGSFTTASNAGKGKFVEAILAAEFDWSGFAPDEYIALIK